MNNHPEYIVAIGASAGGLSALSEMILHFQKGMNAAYCIVLHSSGNDNGEMARDKIRRITSLACHLVTRALPIEKDNIYIASSNQHLLVNNNFVKPGSGTKIGGCRPSIDVMFQSVAQSFTNKSIGIILTGVIDDGILGLCAIKKAGGVSIVQDPQEAEFPVMPQSVINVLKVDHVISISEISACLHNITEKKKAVNFPW